MYITKTGEFFKLKASSFFNADERTVAAAGRKQTNGDMTLSALKLI